MLSETPVDLDEIGFDEPADEIFTPLQLQGILRNAYAWLGRARMDLFNAARTVEWRKRELRHKQNQLRMGEAYALLKNADIRETYLASECATLIVLCETAENELAEARMHFENASMEVEQGRAFLRIAELAQSHEVAKSESAFPGLLVSKKKS